MRTTNPTKAITFFKNQLEGRLRSFSGSFKDMNSLMMRSFDQLFKDTYSLILRGDSLIDAIALTPEIFKTSASRIRDLLSTFGDKMQEMALSIKARNPEWTSKEINEELIRRTKERIDLIARTEIPWLSSALKEAQALEFGYQYFVWHTKKDKHVGEDHKPLEGAIFRVDDLPLQGFPQRSRPNCRCQASFLHLTESQYQIIRKHQRERGIQYEAQ